MSVNVKKCAIDVSFSRFWDGIGSESRGRTGRDARLTGSDCAAVRPAESHRRGPRCGNVVPTPPSESRTCVQRYPNQPLLSGSDLSVFKSHQAIAANGGIWAGGPLLRVLRFGAALAGPGCGRSAAAPGRPASPSRCSAQRCERPMAHLVYAP